MNEELTDVGLQGFICPKSGRNEKFELCYKKCAVHCKPLPVLLSLARQDRGSEQNVFHVTEILCPPQQVFLRRNNPYYMNPDSLVDSNVGSAWHAKLEETKKYVQELGLQDDYLMEKNFKKEFDFGQKPIPSIPDYERQAIMLSDPEKKIILSGTSDLYVKSTKTLWDYKVMKYYYTFKYLSEGKWDDSTIPWQLNIYRYYQHPDAEAIKIFCYIKDFKLNMTEKYDLHQTETLRVPMIPYDKIKKRVVELLTEHVTAQKTGKPRPCTEDELWINRAGDPLRCMYYCAPSEACEQYAKWKEK